MSMHVWFFIFLSFSTLLNELVAVVILPVSEYWLYNFILHIGKQFGMTLWRCQRTRFCPSLHPKCFQTNRPYMLMRTDIQFCQSKCISYGRTKCPYEVFEHLEIYFWTPETFSGPQDGGKVFILYTSQRFTQFQKNEQKKHDMLYARTCKGPFS